MKAFIVNEPCEGYGDVFFAKFAIEARKQGANEFNDGELAGMTCRRCPQLDDKQGDRRAINQYLSDYECWWWDGGEITSDDHPFISVNGGVYMNWMSYIQECETRALMRKRNKKEM